MAYQTEKQSFKRNIRVTLAVLIATIFGIMFFTSTGETEKAMADTAIKGILTSEGVECPAMRGNDGKLYTLVGDLAGHKAGDRVEITGDFMQISNCMQGQTIRLKSIRAGTG